MLPKKPNNNVFVEQGASERIQFCCGAMQGWRPEMEDEHICLPQQLRNGNSLFAVFDGHGGKAVSKFAKAHFTNILTALPQYDNAQYPEALQLAFEGLDELMLTKEGAEELESYYDKKTSIPAGLLCGCTANVILITAQKIYIANCGDSRAAMRVVENGSVSYTELSKDHKPEDAVEMKRIKKAGGFVTNSRVNGNLNLSRALGDFHYKKNTKMSFKEQLITCYPDVKEIERPRTGLIVQGCDGIWQLFQSSSAGLLELAHSDCHCLGLSLQESVRSSLNLLLSKNIIETKGKGCDNMTMTIIFLK